MKKLVTPMATPLVAMAFASTAFAAESPGP